MNLCKSVGVFLCPTDFTDLHRFFMPWARGFCPFGAYSLKAQSGSDLFLQFLDFFQRKLGGCFQNSGKHIKSLLGKCVRCNSGMLEGIEPVEIFHQFLFLAAIQFNNITRGKLFGVIFNRFVYISGFYAIQFSNISVKDDLRIPDDNDFTFCFYNIFLMSHNFFFIAFLMQRYDFSS